MAYKKFIEKNGKVYGPYTYHSRRVNGKVISEYKGKHRKSSNAIDKNLKKGLFIFTALMILILGVLFFNFNFTGHSILSIEDKYIDGEMLKGDLNFVLDVGELIPDSTLVFVSLGNFTANYSLDGLIDLEKSSGTFYIKDKNISGSGMGYGFGNSLDNPIVSFVLEIIDLKEGDSLDEILDSENSISEGVNNSASLTNSTNNTLSINSSTDETELVLNSSNDLDLSENNSSENLENNSNGEDLNLEDSDSESEVEAIVEVSSGNQDNSEDLPLELTDDSEEELEVFSENLEDDSSSDSSEVLESNSDIEDSSEADSSGGASITGNIVRSIVGITSKLFVGITGNVVSNIVDEIEASVSVDNNFEYKLEENKSVRIKEGSVYNLNNNLDESVLDLDINLDKVVISTDYSGEDFKKFVINFDDLKIPASDGELEVLFIYDDVELLKVVEEINVLEFNLTNVTNLTLVNEGIETIQYGAVLNRPVKWKKIVKLNASIDSSIEIPKEASNIGIYKIINETEKVKEIEETRRVKFKIPITAQIISGKISSIDSSEKSEGFFGNLVKSITGRVIEIEETEEVKEIIIEANESDVNKDGDVKNETEYEIEYETPAPFAIETNTLYGKEVIISSEMHYENILVYSELPKGVPESRIKLYHIVNETRLLVSFQAFSDSEDGIVDDINNSIENVNWTDSLNDSINSVNFKEVNYIEWVVSHLSNQTYQIVIEITDAEHLDENYNFINDIYTNVSQLDDVWSEKIYDGEYIRVKFDENLTSDNDITIYPRNLNGSNTIVEVYYFNSSEKIAEFPIIDDIRYYKIYLDNLVGSWDLFDLKIKNLDGDLGSYLEFDHIIDPSGLTYGYNPILNSSSGENTTNENLTLNYYATENNNFTNLTGGIARYDLNVDSGTQVDSWGSNDGTVNGSTYTSSGYLNGGYEFNGSGEIVVPNDVSFNDQTEMTFSYWIKYSQDSLDYKIPLSICQIFNTMIAGPAYGDREGKVNFAIYNSTGQSNLFSNSKPTYDEWHQFTFTYDNDIHSHKIYFDGELDISGTYVGDINSMTNDLFIGNYDDGYFGTFFNGTLDEVQVYNRSLEADEILNNYNLQKNLHNDITESKTIIDWRLNGTSTAILNMPFERSFFTEDIPNDDTIALYHLNSDAVDETGNNDGSVTAASPISDGKINYAYDFDGVGDKIVIPDSDDLSFTDGSGTDEPFSLSYWSKLNFAPNCGDYWGCHTILSKKSEYVIFYGNAFRFRLYDSSTSNFIGFWGGNPTSTTKWSHVVITYNGNETSSGMSLYINGVKATINSETGGTYNGMDNLGYDLELGHNGETTSWYLNGDLDEVKIHDKELSQAEALTLYDSQKWSSTVKDYSTTGYMDAESDAVWYNNNGHDGFGAYYFNGNSQEIDIDYTDMLNFSNNDFTMGTWFKRYAVGSGTEYFTLFNHRYYESGVDGTYVLRSHNNGRLYFIIVDDQTADTLFSAPWDDDTNVWHHVMIRREGTNISMWIDGEYGNSDTRNGEIGQEGGEFSLGKITTGNYWSSFMDDFVVYNSSLSDEMIGAIYNGENDIMLSQETSLGENWSACITLNDRIEDGSELCSNDLTVLVVNVAPNITDMTPINGTITEAGDINFTINITDDYGLVNATIYLYNETGLYNATTILISGTEAVVGIVIAVVDGIYTWFWEVFDNAGLSTSTQNDSTYIGGNYTITSNTPPNTTFVILNSSSLGNSTSENLTCYANINDVNSGDNLDVNYTWYRNNRNNIVNETGVQESIVLNSVNLISTLLSGNTTVDENWTCSVQAYDGVEYEGDWNNATNMIILIANTAPTTVSVLMNATTVNNLTADNLQCYATITDPEEALGLSANYTWYLNGIENETGQLGSITNDTLTLVSTLLTGSITAGENWNCSIQAGDGTEYESSATNSSNMFIRYSAILNFTSPLAGSYPRGKDQSGEDSLDGGEVTNNLTILAQVHDLENVSQGLNANCSFFINDSLYGYDVTNSTGHCTYQFDKTIYDFGTYEIKTNFSDLQSNATVYDSQKDNETIIEIDVINFSAISGNVYGSGVNYYQVGEMSVLEFNVSKNGVLTNYDDIEIRVLYSADADTVATRYSGTLYNDGTGRYRYAALISLAPTGDSIRWVVRVNDSDATTQLATTQHNDRDVAASDGITYINVIDSTSQTIDATVILKDVAGYTLGTETLSSLNLFNNVIRKNKNYSIEINFSTGESLDFYNINLSETESNLSLQRVSDYSGVLPSDVKNLTSVFGFESLDYSFDNATLTISKINQVGDRIKYCDTWDSDNANCTGSWSTVSPFSSNTTHIWFNVTSFSAYAGGVPYNANITIWDSNDTDMLYGDNEVVSNNLTYFYVNYTNSTSGVAISGGDCNITFDGSTYDMNYNTTFIGYDYSYNFTIASTYSYTVSCNDSTYDTISTSDSVVIPASCTASNACATTTCTGSTCTDDCGTVYAGTMSCSGDGCTDTCSSKGYECGSQSVCGNLVTCGTCATGFSCSSGSCIEDECDPACEGDSVCSMGVCITSCNNVPDNSEICLGSSYANMDASLGFACPASIFGSIGDCIYKCSEGYIYERGLFGRASLCKKDLTCVPDCGGDVCGTDGCGGSCGECDEDEVCLSGECIWGECDESKCGEWSSCYLGSQFRSCSNDLCEDERSCTCEEDWKCSWTECVEGDEFSYPYSCIDLSGCGTEEDKPSEKIDCSLRDQVVGVDKSGTCSSKWECTEWDQCSASYGLKDLIGKTNILGIQNRNCIDKFECRDNKIELKECNYVVPVYAKSVEWCNEEYVEVFEKGTGELISRVKELNALGFNRVDISFVLSNVSQYCDYCYDDVKNYDEIEVDCGGDSCPKCLEKIIFFDWLTLLIKFLWVCFVLVCLVGIRIYRESIYSAVKSVNIDKIKSRAMEKRIAGFMKIMFRKKTKRYVRRKVESEKPVKKKVLRKWFFGALIKRLRHWRSHDYYGTVKEEGKIGEAEIKLMPKYKLGKIFNRRENRKIASKKKIKINNSEKKFKVAKEISEKDRQKLMRRLRYLKNKGYYGTSDFSKQLKKSRRKEKK